MLKKQHKYIIIFGCLIITSWLFGLVVIIPKASAQIIGPIDLCFSDSSCKTTEYCSKPSRGGRKCEPKKPIGEKCDDPAGDVQCQSGSCQQVGTKKVCVDLKTGDGTLVFEPVAPKLQIEIPTLQPFTTKDIKPDSSGYVNIPFLGQYMVAIFRWALLVAGVIALALVIFGGFIYLTSGGNAQKTQLGKDRIKQALLGLLLLLSSYTILYIINPDLVKFKPLKVKVLERMNLDSLSPCDETAGLECFLANFGDSSQDISNKLVDVTLFNQTIKVHPLAKDAFEKVNQATKNINYKINYLGTYAWRENVNTATCQLSLHSFGIAVDINKDENPNYKRKAGETKCKSDIPDEIVKAFKDNGFRWGGDYKKHCDAMHFEWLGPCGQTPSVSNTNPANPNPGNTSPTTLGCCTYYSDGSQTDDIMESVCIDPTYGGTLGNIWTAEPCLK